MLVSIARAAELARGSARAQAATQRPFAALFDDPAVRRTLLLWTAATIALQFGYYGANTWLPSYLTSDLGVDMRSMGWFVASTYAMTIVGKVVCGWLGDVLGRRAVWVGTGLLTAFYIPLLMYVATPTNVAWLPAAAVPAAVRA